MTTYRVEIKVESKMYAGDRDIVDTDLLTSGHSDNDGDVGQAFGEALCDLLKLRPGLIEVAERCCRAAHPVQPSAGGD